MDVLTRKPKSDNYVEPMPKKQLQRIVRSFKAKGGVIQMSEETDAFLKRGGFYAECGYNIAEFKSVKSCCI